MKRLLLDAPELNIMFGLLSVIGQASAFGQCATVYVDQGGSGTTASAWNTLVDNYTDLGTSCAQWSGSFSHTYTVQITLTSANRRNGYGYSGGSQSSGSGSGFASTSASLSVYSDGGDTIDVGTWTIQDSENINCSIAGQFFANASTRFFQVGSSANIYDLTSQYVDPLLFRHCNYTKINPCVVNCPWALYAERVIFNYEPCSPRAVVQVPWIRFGIITSCISGFGRVGPLYIPSGCYNFPN